MPKIIDYPRASLKRALQLAEVVDRLGGECTDQSAAEAMGNTVSGAFRALAYATVKYGFLSYSKSKLRLEPLYNDYKLAYSEPDKQVALRKAFLSVPLFTEIAKRFEHQQLPPHFEKLLIREHQVSEPLASRVCGYFIEGAKEAGILQSDGSVNAWPQNVTLTPGTGSASLQAGGTSTTASATMTLTPSPEPEPPESVTDGYTVRITGPGMDSKIRIKDVDDIAIVNITLKKIEKLITAEDSLLK
jgi:hypothetical protein